jgi:hypothetical protein
MIARCTSELQSAPSNISRRRRRRRSSAYSDIENFYDFNRAPRREQRLDVHRLAHISHEREQRHALPPLMSSSPIIATHAKTFNRPSPLQERMKDFDEVSADIQVHEENDSVICVKKDTASQTSYILDC